jgi:hypothetical protein
MLSDLAALKSVRLRETLAAHRIQILQTEELARLREDVPVDSLSPCWGTPSAEARTAVGKLFAELEFRSLIGRLESLRGP